LKQTQQLFGYQKEDVLFAMEFTGIYNYHLLEVLEAAGFSIWLIPGIEINASKGLQRSKNDKEDAKQIAQYAAGNLKKIRLWNKPRTVLKELQSLLMMREKLLLSKHQYETTMKEYKSYSGKEEYIIIKNYSTAVLKTICRELINIERQIKEIIQGATQRQLHACSICLAHKNCI
jgi:transposase